MSAFKAINDTLLPEAFKPNLSKKGEDRDELFQRWREELVNAYELYSSAESSDSMHAVIQTLRKLYEDGVLGKNNRRTVKEVQEKYAQLTMIMVHEDFTPEASLDLLEDPLIKLCDLFPENIVILLALTKIYTLQRMWLRAYYAAKFGLRKQPFERNLIRMHLHALFNLGAFDEFEAEQKRYKSLVNYEPQRVLDPEEHFQLPDLVLTAEKPTWNALLKSFADVISSKHLVWCSTITKVELKVSESFSLDASGYNTPSQSGDAIAAAEVEEENSQPTAKKRAASAQARKNLKKQKVTVKKNVAQFGFDFEGFLKKYNFYTPQVATAVVALQDRLQVPQIELGSDVIQSVEGRFLVEAVHIVLSRIPHAAWILTEFIDLVQALLEKNAQDFIASNEMLIAISKTFHERKIEANRDKLKVVVLKRELNEALNYFSSEIQSNQSRDQSMEFDSALMDLLDRLTPFNIQTQAEGFLENYVSQLLPSNDSLIAFLVVLSKKLVMEKDIQTRLVSFLMKGFVQMLELDESIYELALMLQKSDVLSCDVALCMALSCPVGDYQFEILRALFHLNRVKEASHFPLAVFSEKVEVRLPVAQCLTSYFEVCWMSVDCNLDEVALLKGIEVVLENVSIRSTDQQVLQANLGRMKRYFRTECRNIFNYALNRVPPLLAIRETEELLVRKRLLQIRVEVCEDAFSNRKRNVEWLKGFRKDLMYMLACIPIGGSEFAEYWEKLTLVHFEFAYQLLCLDPSAIRGKENKIRRNLKKFVMMSLVGNCDYNRVTEALFMMLHSLANIYTDVEFRRSAAAYLLKILRKAKDLSSKSRLLCILAMTINMQSVPGQELLSAWMNEQLQELNAADYELLYLGCFFLDRLGVLDERILCERLGIEIEHSVLSVIGPQFNLHKGREDIFPFYSKPKGLTFCGLHVPAILPGFSNFCVQELTKELIDGEEDVEMLLLVLNRLRNLEAQLPNPTELITRCSLKLFLSALKDGLLIDQVLKEVSNNKGIPEVAAIVEKLKSLKKSTKEFEKE